MFPLDAGFKSNSEGIESFWLGEMCLQKTVSLLFCSFSRIE